MKGARWLITKGRLVTPAGLLANPGLLVEDGSFRLPAGEVAGVETLDATGCYLFPGMADLHLHGAGGYDVMRGEIRELARYLAGHGVTAFLPTAMAASPQEMLRVAEAVGAYQQEEGAAEVLGLHMEGPYLNPRRAGFQDTGVLRPFSREEVASWLRALGGKPLRLTIAPEVVDPGDIAWLRSHGVILSLGHSEAIPAQVRQAADLGVTMATHLFNAMGTFSHRDPGTAGGVLATRELRAEVIGDGAHVHPLALTLALQLKGGGGLFLVSDALPPADPGLISGQRFIWRGQALVYRQGAFWQKDGHLAGGGTLLWDQLRFLLEHGVLSLTQAAQVAAETPAAVLGLSHRKGRVADGFDADLLVVDEGMRLRWIFVRGNLSFPPS